MKYFTNATAIVNESAEFRKYVQLYASRVAFVLKVTPENNEILRTYPRPSVENGI